MDDSEPRTAEVGQPRRPWEHQIPMPTWGDRLGAVLADGVLVIDICREDRSGYEGIPMLQLIADLDAALRVACGIPPGFPLWYVSPRPQLTVGPIGRYIQSTQCRCGHVEAQHIVLLDECLAGCDCPRYVPRTPAADRPAWRERLRRLARTVIR